MHRGPPTRYELKTFCALLNTGRDRAYVIIPHAMLIPGSGLVMFGQKYDLLTLLNISNLGGLTAKEAQTV